MPHKQLLYEEDGCQQDKCGKGCLGQYLMNPFCHLRTVALSVSLTACSSIITLFTIPVIMEFATHFVDSNLDIDIHLPVGRKDNWRYHYS